MNNTQIKESAFSSAIKTRNIPLNYKLHIEMESNGLAIYHGESKLYAGAVTSLRFFGRSSKPCEHYRYRSIAERAEADSKFIENMGQREIRKAQQKAERKAITSMPHTLNIGDILVSSWGWEQTNVDFYQVVGLRGKFVVQLQEIGCESIGCEGSYMSDMVIAKKDHFVGEVFEKRINSRNSCNISSCQYARLWDGSKMYRSWYA